MVAPTRGSVKADKVRPSSMQYWTLVAILTAFAFGAGYMAAIQPINKWRYFSWHPFLMTCGMVGLAGISAVTKKMGGYENTKLHGILASLSTVTSAAGLYVIYTNKEQNGYSHLQSAHAKFGAAIFLTLLLLGAVGGIVLHPDFGIDNTNSMIRSAHKKTSRVVLIMAWFTALYGLYGMTKDPITLAVYGIPLLLLIPFVLV